MSKWKFLKGEDLAINIASGVYYAVKSFRGIPNLFKTTKQIDKKKARRELPNLIKAHLDRYSTGNRGETPTISEVIKEIERTESPQLRSKTQAKRTYYFKCIAFDMELGNVPIDQLTLKLWTQRLNKLQEKSQRKTFWDYAKHANILIRYAYEQKYIVHKITFDTPDPKKQTGTVLSPEEIKVLFEVMGETTRDQFVLSYECCMRLREVLHLTWDRVNLKTGEITLRAEDVKTGSKTGKGRQFIVTQHALDRLRKRAMRQVPLSLWVFPSKRRPGPVNDNKNAWNMAKKKALKRNPSFQINARWHDLRHSSISRMLVEQGMNITMVSEYCGTAVNTLQKTYLHSKAEHTKGVTGLLTTRR